MNDSDIDILIRRAREGMENSYGVDPGTRNYGAAVLTKQGNIYSSGVYKSETRTLSLHAEQCALAHAAAHGEHIIVAIAIVSNEDLSGKTYTNPCGLCKQLLYESSIHSGVNIDVILTNGSGNYQIKSLSEMIVYPWPAMPQ